MEKSRKKIRQLNVRLSLQALARLPVRVSFFTANALDRISTDNSLTAYQ